MLHKILLYHPQRFMNYKRPTVSYYLTWKQAMVSSGVIKSAGIL
ncbi:hypothetical protein CRENPOLYSF1_430138 [Crenothrix polyspora]|uniref:Uncharacterized protein n=1 Tax=Crenothrix polyspora TaxID=360316 RepID=A0A1R4HBA8_9GAMM|nr:hypothetical protein CRENPOLYSF1_430138 [Crenothrix polyspora]